MTDGATARDSDASTQAKLLKIAFKKYYAMQHATFNLQVAHNDYFMYRNDIETIKMFGIEATAGIMRQPIITETMWKDLRRHIFKIAAMRQQQKDQPIGHDYIVRNKRYKFFVPDIITSVENQINQIILQKKQAQKSELKINIDEVNRATRSDFWVG